VEHRWWESVTTVRIIHSVTSSYKVSHHHTWCHIIIQSFTSSHTRGTQMVESVTTVRNNIRSTNLSVVKMTRTQVSFHTGTLTVLECSGLFHKLTLCEMSKTTRTQVSFASVPCLFSSMLASQPPPPPPTYTHTHHTHNTHTHTLGARGAARLHKQLYTSRRNW
jgi:hypothetical protein